MTAYQTYASEDSKHLNDRFKQSLYSQSSHKRPPWNLEKVVLTYEQ